MGTYTSRNLLVQYGSKLDCRQLLLAVWEPHVRTRLERIRPLSIHPAIAGIETSCGGPAVAGIRLHPLTIAIDWTGAWKYCKSDAVRRGSKPSDNLQYQGS